MELSRTGSLTPVFSVFFSVVFCLISFSSVLVSATDSIVYGWKVTAVGNVVLTTPYEINCVWIPNNNVVKRCSVVLDVNNTGSPVNVNKNTVGLVSRAFNAANLVVQRSTTYSAYTENYSINSTNSVNVSRRKFTNWVNASNTVSLSRGVTGVKLDFLLPKYSAGLFNATVGSFVVDPEVTECGVINSEGYYWLTQNLSGETCIQFQDDTARDIDFNCDGYSIIFANGRAFDSVGDASQSNITIRNCVMDCSLYQPDKPCTDSKGVSAYSESNWNITNNTILMNYGTEIESPRYNYGINFHDGGNGGWIENNFFDLTDSTSSYSAYLEAPSVNVTNNTFFGSSDGVVTSGYSNSSLNTFFNTTNYCLQTNGYDNVSNNNFSYCGAGVWTNGDYNTVFNNTVNATTGECIRINSGAHNTVSSNNVSYCGYWQPNDPENPQPNTAYNLVDADYSLVSNNYASIISSAFTSSYGSDYCNFTFNSVYDDSGAAFGPDGDYVIVANNVASNVVYGFNPASSADYLLVANNSFTGTGSYGAGVSLAVVNGTYFNNTVSRFNYGFLIYNLYNINTRFINCNTSSNTYDVYFTGYQSNCSFVNHSFQGVTANFSGYRVWLNSTLSKPTDPATFLNISKYVNATNHSANGWLAINFSYSTGDLGSVSEASLRVARFNASWETDASKFASSYGVNTANNYVYANITKFTATNALFAALGQEAAAVVLNDVSNVFWLRPYWSDGFVVLQNSYYKDNQKHCFGGEGCSGSECQSVEGCAVCDAALGGCVWDYLFPKGFVLAQRQYWFDGFVKLCFGC